MNNNFGNFDEKSYHAIQYALFFLRLQEMEIHMDHQ